MSKELVRVEAMNGCTGCFYNEQYDNGSGCLAPDDDWISCIKDNVNQYIYVEKDDISSEYYEPHELPENINEAELACGPKGFYKDLSRFTDRWASDKIKEIWIKSTGHKPSYDTYIPFKLKNGITYIVYYTRRQVIGLVMLYKKSLKRCYFVNNIYQHIEITKAENEYIEFVVMSNLKKIEFKLNE